MAGKNLLPGPSLLRQLLSYDKTTRITICVNLILKDLLTFRTLGKLVRTTQITGSQD